MAGRISQQVEQALRQAEGDQTLAQKLLLKAALADEELLRELVAPYLKGITAQAVLAAGAGATPLPPSKARAAMKPAEKYNPMRASALSAAPVTPRPAASSRHVSTLKLLAAAYQAKRGEKV